MIDRVNKFLPFLAIFFGLWMVVTVFRSAPEATLVPEVSTLAPQLSAIPQGFPRVGKETPPSFDPRFSKVDPLTAYKIPTVQTFSAPMGSHTGMFTYNAQKYWENNPHRRGHHTGDDLNGIGGWNSDFGDPVYSIADGLVVYSGNPGPGWGNVLIIAHRVEKDGPDEIIQSMYAHLQQCLVLVDEVVPRGKKVGTVGSANGQYLAHLHFELRKGLNLHIGPGYLRSPRTHLSPEEFLKRYLTQEAVFTTSLADRPAQNWQDLEIKASDPMSEDK